MSLSRRILSNKAGWGQILVCFRFNDSANATLSNCRQGIKSTSAVQGSILITKPIPPLYIPLHTWTHCFSSTILEGVLIFNKFIQYKVSTPCCTTPWRLQMIPGVCPRSWTILVSMWASRYSISSLILSHVQMQILYDAFHHLPFVTMKRLPLPQAPPEKNNK